MEDYKRFLNQVIGFISMGLAMAAISTSRPQLFGTFFFIVVVAHLMIEAQCFYRNNPRPSISDVLGDIFLYIPYLVGLLMLFSVGIGWLDKSGLYLK